MRQKTKVNTEYDIVKCQYCGGGVQVKGAVISSETPQPFINKANTISYTIDAKKRNAMIFLEVKCKAETCGKTGEIFIGHRDFSVNQKPRESLTIKWRHHER